MSIDCVIIGNNQMKFKDYVRSIERMGVKSGAFRDINLHYYKDANNYYSMADFYNKEYMEPDVEQPLSYNNMLSATIAYLGTFLNKHNISFSYINSFQEQKAELASLIIEKKVKSVAITTTYYVSVLPILEIIDFVRQYSSAVKIIVGGPFIATQHRILNESEMNYLYREIDADFYINSSQGEMALVKVINSIKKIEDIFRVENVAFKKNDKFIKNKIIKENNCLEDNAVDWKLFSDCGKKMVAVRTAISCPFSCSFCSFPQHAGEFTYISPMRLYDELEQLNSSVDVNSVYFLDDTFNVPINRFKEILRLMANRKWSFKWNSHFRCQYVDREMVELMKKSGCEGVFLGIESGNQSMLENMNKKSRIEEYYRGIELLREYEILTYASFIIGFPGETKETIKDTIQFIEKAKPDFYRAQLWYYDTTTPIHLKSSEYGLRNSQFEWEHNTMNYEEAADWIDYIFLNVKNSIWLPQNNFDYSSLFNLLSRGRNIDSIKQMIVRFNEQVALKIKNKEKEYSNRDYSQVPKFNF